MPKRIHCAHIFANTEKEASAVLERLGKGEKFAYVAKEVSLCPQANAEETSEHSAEERW